MVDKTSRLEIFCHEEPLLLAHLEAVLKYNRKKNLTGIRDLEAGKVLHIEDSLAVLPEVKRAPAGEMADLGSGAGYPGIPLSLASGRKTTLIEANKKKSRFLQNFLETHSLAEQIKVAAVRAEEMAKEKPECFSVITVRAVASLPVLLELATPLLALGGRLLALKGAAVEEELLRGDNAAKILGMRRVESRYYSLSDGESKRSVFVYEKVKGTTVDLPRRPGIAAKRPLA